MKAKRLEIETCKGLVALSDVVYHFISEDILEIHFSYSIFDNDLEKEQAIIKTQLWTEREFTKGETEKGYHLCFNYPYNLVKALLK